ncbi:hypothetical protein SB861_64515, partial [Paraburkholderia sp. SIMBA_049]
HAAELRDGEKALEMTEFDAAVREASLHNERLYEKGENVTLHNRAGWIKSLHKLHPQFLEGDTHG